MRFKFDAKHFFLTLLGSCRYYEGQLADLTELEDDGPEPKDSKKLLTEAATEVCLLILVGGLAWNWFVFSRLPVRHDGISVFMLDVGFLIFVSFLFDVKVSLMDETIKPREDLPSILTPVNERNPEKLHYLGVSFGVTQSLFNFWQKRKFVPVYVRQTPVSLFCPICF
jgi:tRNA(Met) C34 N-acetyltransferase TmcA